MYTTQSSLSTSERTSEIIHVQCTHPHGPEGLQLWNIPPFIVACTAIMCMHARSHICWFSVFAQPKGTETSAPLPQ